MQLEQNHVGSWLKTPLKSMALKTRHPYIGVNGLLFFIHENLRTLFLVYALSIPFRIKNLPSFHSDSRCLGPDQKLQKFFSRFERFSYMKPVLRIFKSQLLAIWNNQLRTSFRRQAVWQ